ncbi:cysteine desulfurase family protein [Enterococcus sp. BWR-S5]|uniref:cysteine desulfurase family protein n=1 Tax=Enterococcus sp. BWR-S5 TaxID=2787714 RepID=UPI0019246A3E|nr:cysteine desulfurase family protein [Enterococcus sp. BWR-S5]MBL1223927.1 cysteine desulfurase [Enterococcus sp. BWR-S5]
MKYIYLDHAATTPMHPDVIEEMTTVMNSIFGNPSSIHGVGREAHQKLEAVRQVIADSLKVKPHEIIFTSGGTEGDNTAIIETAEVMKKQGKHIITTAVEHPAVLQPLRYLESKGYDVTYLPVDESGRIILKDFKSALREDTILVSIVYGNSETGQLMPIKEIGEILQEHPAVFHTDAVQAYGSEEISPKEMGIDLLSASGHKINGPKGVGFLYKRDGLVFQPLLRGGEQEEKRRAGTENIAGIAGMGKAVEWLTPAEKAAHKAKNKDFQEIILDKLSEAGIDYQINGDCENKLSHILNIWFKGVSGDLLLMHLDLNGVAVSIGSACTAGTVDPSHVLEAIYGKGHPAVKESLRISFGYGNTEEEMIRFADLLIKTVQRLKN